MLFIRLQSWNLSLTGQHHPQVTIHAYCVIGTILGIEISLKKITHGQDLIVGSEDRLIENELQIIWIKITRANEWLSFSSCWDKLKCQNNKSCESSSPLSEEWQIPRWLEFGVALKHKYCTLKGKMIFQHFCSHGREKKNEEL